MASNEKMSLCVENNNVNNSLPTSWGSTKISVGLPALQSLEVALTDNRKKYADKVQALLWAWEQVLNCMNKDFSLSVFEFMHGHTLHLVLRGDWPRLAPAFQTHLQVLLKRCLQYLNSKHANASSIPRCSSLITLVSNPWGHSTLFKLIHGQPTTDEEVVEYCETEKGDLIMIRLELLIGSKCEDIALNLAGAAVRWMRVPNSGCETYSSPDQRNFFLAVYLTTLCRKKRTQEIIAQLKNLDLKEGLELVKRFGSANWPSNLNGTLSGGTSTARIWRHGSRVAEIAAHTFLASAMVQAPSPLLADLVLEWAKIHGPTLKSAPDTLFDMIKKFLQTADSLEHICMFSGVLAKQFGDCVKPICIEFFVRFMTAEINDLEQLKMKKEQEIKREVEIKLACGFLKLADLVGSSYLDIYRECVLTGFSLNPSAETLSKIIELAAGDRNESVSIPAELNEPPTIKTETNEERSDCANNLANESITGDAIPNQVSQTDENLHPEKHGTEEVSKVNSIESIEKKNECVEIRHFEGIGKEDRKEAKEDFAIIETIDDKLLNPSSHTSNFEKEGDALGLSRHLMDDFATVLRHPRYQSLNWDQNWDELKCTCENYLNDYSNFRDASTKELKYLKIDYNQFKDWPEDDKDKYFGIEKGYEKWMDESDESDEPYSGSASCSQSIDDSDFESCDSLLRKKPQKKKEISRRRSDSDSEYEIGKYRNKKKRKKLKKSPTKVIEDSDNGTLDSIKSTNSVLREKSVRKKSKKSKDSCRGTLRSKTLMKNAQSISSQLDDTKSNESLVKFSDNFSDSLYSDNENDNNNSSQRMEPYQEMENISSNVIVNENNKTKDSRTNILKTLRTFRRAKPDHKQKIGFSFFNNNSEDNFSLQRECSTYAPNLNLSTMNSNSHAPLNKNELREELDNYFSENCKYTFCEDEPLNIGSKLKPFSKLDKSNKTKSSNFDLPLEDKNMVRNPVSDLNSLENLVPPETNATVQVVQVTNHSTVNCTNSTVPACQTSSADKPVPQSTSTMSQNSSIQRNTNLTVSSISQTEISSSIKTQNSSNTDSQSSSQIFSTSIQNNINAIIESSETQNTSETITLQRAEPVNNQSTHKVQVQSQSAIVIQNEQQIELKQPTSSNPAANNVNNVRPPRTSAFVLVASGDSSNSVPRTTTFSQQQLPQAFINLTNSSLVGTNIDSNTATLFKAEDRRKPENVVHLTVSRDSRLLVTQQLANIKRSDSAVNVVINQSANFTNARSVETKANTTQPQKINSTLLRLEPGSSIVKARPLVSQGTQNASLPKFQQAFGKTMYQSVTCPVGTGDLSENKVVSVLGLNQVQIQPESTALPSCSVVSKGVQTIKDSGSVVPKPDSTESSRIVIKAETSNSQIITTPVPQTISQVKTTQIRTSAMQTSPGVIFTCKRLAVVKEQDSPGNSAPVKKTDTKILKDPIRLNELLTAALQANAPVQTVASGSNVANIVNPLHQTIQISNSSDNSNKIKVETPTGTTQRLNLPSIIQKSISSSVRQTVLQPSSYKFKPFQPSESSQPAVLKLPLSVRSAFLSTLSNLNQPVTATSSSNASTVNQNRTGIRESLVVRSRIDPNVSSTSMDSSTTLEQVREFESVLEQVTKTSQMKERINVQFHTSQDSSTASNEANPTAFSSVASSQSNASATPSSTTMELQGERVLSYVTQTTSSETSSPKMSSSTPVVVVQSCRRQAASPALSICSQSSSSPIPCSSGKAQKSSKPAKSKIVKTPPVTSPLKVTPTIPKPQQKPQEDEQTTQRIYAILDKYAEQLRNSPELKNKPAPRRRSNPPTNPTQSSKRKKSSQSRSRSNSQQASCSLGLDMSPSSEDVRTMGSEDSSNGVSQLSQVTSSPQSRIDDTPATPSSETSESLDARDSRIQIQVQPQPQTQPVVTSRALIVQDALLNSESTKILNTQTRQSTVVANASSVSLPAGTVRLFVTKGPKMYKIQQMVPMVLRPGVTKISGGITTQSVATMSGQQAVVLPTGTRSFTFAEATSEQSVNLDNTIVPSGISLLQLQSTNSSTTNISTLVPASSTALPTLATSISETNRVPVTSNSSAICHLSLNQSKSSNTSELLLETNNKETSVWSDFSTGQGNKSVFLSKHVKTEPATFSCQTDLKLELRDSSSPNLLKQDDIRLENSLDGKEESKSSLLAEDGEIKKEIKEEVEDARVGACEETVSWQQYCLSKEDASQDDKSLQTMSQSMADVDHCHAPNATLTLSHAKRKASTLDNTLFQSTYRRSDRLQTSKRCDGSQQKKAELKSLSEECKDLGVDKPSASDLFPEAELLLDLDPSSQEAEIQLLMNPEPNYDSKECGMNFLQGDNTASLKTYARSNAKSKLKQSSSPSSPHLKISSDSDSPILGQSELYSSPSEKAHTKPDTTSVSSSLDIDSSPQDSSFESQQKMYSQCGSPKLKSSDNLTTSSSKSRKRVLTRSHRPHRSQNVSKLDKRKNPSQSTGSQTPQENSVNGRFDLDSDSVDFKKSLQDLTEEEEKLHEHSMDHDYPSLTTPTHSSSDTVFSSDPQLNTFDSTNSPFLSSSAQNNFRSQSRLKSNQDQDSDSLWSLIKKADQGDDLDSDIDKTTTSDTEDPASENELPLSTNGLGKRRSGSAPKTAKSKVSKIVKEDLDVASSASSPEVSDGDKVRVSRRSSLRGLVKKPCSCCNGSPEQPKRKNHSHISTSSCSASSKKNSGKGQSLLKSVLKKR